MTTKQEKAMERNMAKGAVTRAMNFIDALVVRDKGLKREELAALLVIGKKLSMILEEWEKR